MHCKKFDSVTEELVKHDITGMTVLEEGNPKKRILYMR